jgi:hypothetical protein
MHFHLAEVIPRIDLAGRSVLNKLYLNLSDYIKEMVG